MPSLPRGYVSPKMISLREQVRMNADSSWSQVRGYVTRRSSMDKEKAYLVIHPKAEQHVAAIVNILEERWNTIPLVTRYAGHGIEMVENAPEQGYHWIIALGGDGTLNEVVNGAMKARQPCTVAVLPGGTANDWAHEMGLPEHPIDAARA